MPESGNPSLPPPTGSYYLWLSTDGFFKKMDSAGNVSNLSAQSLNDLNDVDLTGLQDGQGIAWNALDQKWQPITFPEGGGVGTFVELTDTPLQYTGMSGKVVSVNESENALEFSDKAAGASITNARYKYQTASSDTNGAGAVRFNNSDPSLATQIFFNRVDLDGHDLNEFFATFIDETYSVFLQNENDKNSAIKVKILGSGTLGGGTLGGQLQTWIFPCEYNRGTSTSLTNNTECSTVFLHTTPVEYPVESVNGETGVVVLDADDIDDSTTDHKFANQAQLDQIATNATNISTNAGDIANLETDVGNLETQVNTNTSNIVTNTSNIALIETEIDNLESLVNINTSDIATNTSNISTNASDISDLQDQIDGGVGKTYTGVEAIEVNNTDDQVSLKLTEDNSGQLDNVTVSGFNSDFNHSFEVVKRDGERVNIDLDLEGQNIILNYDSGTHQLYRCLTHDDMFIGYCDEIGYWIAVKLTVSHTFDVELNGSATLGLQNWVQLGTLSSLLGNGNYVPASSYLSYTGFAINNSYLSQSASGLTANVSSDLSAAQAFELADALAVKQSLDAKLNDPDTSLQVNRPYYLERTEFNGIILDTWVQTSTLGGDDPRWTADPVKLGQDAGLSGQGAESVAIGLTAGYNSQGTGSIAIGKGAGSATQGVNSVAIGLECGETDQGSQSVAIGWKAGEDTQGDYNVAIGYQAGLTTQGDGAVAMGKWAGQTNQGVGCFAFGQSTGNLNQADYALAIGTNAGQTTQGTKSIAIGFAAGNGTQGAGSLALGENAGQTNQGAASFAMGTNAGQTSQLDNSLAIGTAAGQFNQADRCMAIGFQAGNLDQGQTGLAIGYNAGRNRQGERGVAIGRESAENDQGSRAVAIGYRCGRSDQGQYSVAIGLLAGETDQPSRSICINSDSTGTNPSSEKQIVIGRSDYDVRIGDGNVSSVSDARDKYAVQDIPLGLDFVNALQPKFYKYDIRELYEETDEEGVVTKNVPNRSKAGIRFHSGFLAQDVKAAMDSFGVDFGVYRDEAIKAEEAHRERSIGKLSLCYREFIAIQTKAIQELSVKVDSLEAEIAILKGR